jgi:hypothetical protein
VPALAHITTFPRRRARNLLRRQRRCRSRRSRPGARISRNDQADVPVSGLARVVQVPEQFRDGFRRGHDDTQQPPGHARTPAGQGSASKTTSCSPPRRSSPVQPGPASLVIPCRCSCWGRVPRGYTSMTTESSDRAYPRSEQELVGETLVSEPAVDEKKQTTDQTGTSSWRGRCPGLARGEHVHDGPRDHRHGVPSCDGSAPGGPRRSSRIGPGLG